MEVSEEQLINLKNLINSLNGFKLVDIKKLYKNVDITTIDNLKNYILNRSDEQKEYLQILLVLNSKQEPHGHYIVVDSYGRIFDPLGSAGLTNMDNITSEVKDYLYKYSNMEIIQTINSECCGLLCLLFVYLNIITMNKNKCFVNVKTFKNIFNLIYELILDIKNY